MSVKFEFIIDDVDAENLFGIVRGAANRARQEATKSLAKGRCAEAEYHKRDAAYILDLLAGMRNNHID